MHILIWHMPIQQEAQHQQLPCATQLLQGLALLASKLLPCHQTSDELRLKFHFAANYASRVFSKLGRGETPIRGSFLNRMFRFGVPEKKDAKAKARITKGAFTYTYWDWLGHGEPPSSNLGDPTSKAPGPGPGL